ncbi:hypothetical protein [Devosia sediminis]|uniref:Uncharacterized protein n=1 Tax=Devosia sediminis TaxID=2798801 RepID=A0A934MG78_9HYPH|nr:hypothetical protein [Devosia sediminis]MBJ3783662.1 hypothetical protein [Devosia sediminis]
MAYGSTKINRYNMHQFSSYDRMQYQRERKAMAAETIQKNANLANSFANIQASNAVEMGNIYSKMAMSRISKTA